MKRHDASKDNVRSIDILNLPIHQYNALKRANINTIDELQISIENESITMVTGFGTKGMAIVIDKLNNHLIQYPEDVLIIKKKQVNTNTRSLDNLKLPTYQYNALLRANINTIDELQLSIENKSIMEVKGFCSRGLAIVIEKLNQIK